MAFVGVAAAFVVIQPTVQVALIAGTALIVASAISAGTTIIVGRIARRDQKQDAKEAKEEARIHAEQVMAGQREITEVVADVKKNTDGLISAAKAELEHKSTQLSESEKQLHTAEGYRAGSESERKP
jgi:membrane protein implicated in regulation of membrane protease activity